MKELMKKTNTKLKKERGITLIALVVTIIVLLILAGISIMMLTGQNGILRNAGKASKDTGRVQMIELAKIDLLDEKTKNNGKITEEMVKEVLSRYFRNVPDDLPDDLSTLILEDGTYDDIKASEIYDGTFTTEKLEPGLYSRAGRLIINWEQLIERGYITDDNNVLTGLKDMEGKLVIRDGVTEITKKAFENCRKIFEFVIPASVTTIGDGGLYTSNGLEAITVKGENPNFKSIDGVLFSKTGKTLIQYPMNKGNETYTVPGDTLSIGYGAFYKANLQTINIGNATKICIDAFGESKIREVTFSNSLKKIEEYAFEKCQELTEIELPSGIEKIGGAVFSSCPKLQSAKLPDPFPEEILPYSLFEECSNLIDVNIPANITEIRSECFSECTSLTTIDLPNGLKKIGTDAFCYIINLDTVIPDTVTTLEDYCFYKNRKITSVPEGLTSAGTGVFSTDCALDDISKQRLLNLNERAISSSYWGGSLRSGFEGIKYQEQL